MEYKDYYKILGLSKGATEAQIKSAYRKLARKYHPDINPGNKKAEETFKQVNDAYQVLSDLEKRKKYDALGSNWEQILRDQEYAKQYAGTGAGREFHEAFDMGDFFEAFFGRTRSTGGAPFGFGTARPSGPQRGPDVEHEMPLTLKESYRGTTKSLKLVFQHIGQREERKSVAVTIPQGIADGTRMRLAGAGGRGMHGGRSEEHTSELQSH